MNLRDLFRAPLSSDDLGDAIVIGVCLVVVVLFSCGVIR